MKKDQDIKQSPQRNNKYNHHESNAHTQATIDDNNKETDMKPSYDTPILQILY